MRPPACSSVPSSTTPRSARVSSACDRAAASSASGRRACAAWPAPWAVTLVIPMSGTAISAPACPSRLVPAAAEYASKSESIRTGAPTVYSAVASPSSSSPASSAASAASHSRSTSSAAADTSGAGSGASGPAASLAAATTCQAASSSSRVSSRASAAARAPLPSSTWLTETSGCWAAQEPRSRAARSSGATRAAAASSSRGASRTGGIRGRSRRESIAPHPPAAGPFCWSPGELVTQVPYGLDGM